MSDLDGSAGVELIEWLAHVAPPGSSTWPEARYEVSVEFDVMIPMRDGVRLAADVYRPKGVAGPLPVILSRTPYDKRGLPAGGVGDALHFVGHGFAYVVQDVRGKFGSEGVFSVSAPDREDGSDTVDWIAAQPWSNERVGTYGCSYLGENQLQLAAMRNPHHAAAIAKSPGGAARYFGAVDGGAFMLSGGMPFFARAGRKYRTDYSQPEGVDIPKSAFWWLPTISILERLGAPETDYEDMLRHPPADVWWRARGYITAEDRFATPILLVDGWFDYGAADTLRVFQYLRRNSDSDTVRDAHRVIIAPTLHCTAEFGTADTVVGDCSFGDARREYYRLYLRWFDRWLRDGDGTVLEPRVQVFVMGANGWRCEHDWPPTSAVALTYYLHSGGEATTRDGDGRLTLEPAGDQPFDEYTYDPADPVPSVGGPILVGIGDYPAGPCEQSRVETRADVLVYTSEPLEKALEVTGSVRAFVHLSSSCRDTDLVAKLTDVAPNGRSILVCDGIMRVRYREGYERAALMEPGEVYEVPVDLHATSWVFERGHCLRLQLTSSNFPHFDRNLNTGGANFDESEGVAATNRIFHDAMRLSRLVLTVATDDGAAICAPDEIETR